MGWGGEHLVMYQYLPSDSLCANVLDEVLSPLCHRPMEWLLLPIHSDFHCLISMFFVIIK